MSSFGLPRGADIGASKEGVERMGAVTTEAGNRDSRTLMSRYSIDPEKPGVTLRHAQACGGVGRNL